MLENPATATRSFESSQYSAQSDCSLVWSATPTPLLDDGSLDLPSVARCIEYHIRLGCDGIMLAGTCGEGPWLTSSDLEGLVRAGLDASAGRIAIAVQATDNSPRLILERLEKLAELGVSLAVLAQPYFLMNATEARLRAFYREVLDQSPISIGFYDRGRHAAVPLSIDTVAEILSHPKVVMEKDSSSDPERWRRAREIRAVRPELRLMNGDEFQLVGALEAGFDGSFFGGAVLTGMGVRNCTALVRSGKLDEAAALDAEMIEFLLSVYGGKEIKCWLAGLKYALMKLGVFSSHRNLLEYPLTAECRDAIDRAIAAEPDWLLAGGSL